MSGSLYRPHHRDHRKRSFNPSTLGPEERVELQSLLAETEAEKAKARKDRIELCRRIRYVHNGFSRADTEEDRTSRRINWMKKRYRIVQLRKKHPEVDFKE